MIALKNQTIEILKNELRSCYIDTGIIGGTHHFTDQWARDTCFASLGSLEIGDINIVEKNVGTFFKHQRNDGLIPYRIMRGPITLSKYRGNPTYYKTPRPTYRLRGVFQYVLDGTTMPILLNSILGLRKIKSANKYIEATKKGLLFLNSREKNGLLYDGVMAEWNDLALKWGNLLYSNVIYWYMYDRLSKWALTFDKEWSEKLVRKQEVIAQSIRSRLWNGKFFADWYDYKRQDYFYPFGNCLAITWGLTNKKESEKILKQCKKVIFKFTLETNYPQYPWWRIDPLQRLIGMGDYQNKSTLWFMPAATYIMALGKMRKSKDAREFVKIVADKIKADNGVYECYERNGKPVKRWQYSSEFPFAWSSGMLLWAFKNNT